MEAAILLSIDSLAVDCLLAIYRRPEQTTCPRDFCDEVLCGLKKECALQRKTDPSIVETSRKFEDDVANVGMCPLTIRHLW